MSNWYTFLPYGALQWEEHLKAIIFFGSGFVGADLPGGIGFARPDIFRLVNGRRMDLKFPQFAI